MRRLTFILNLCLILQAYVVPQAYSFILRNKLQTERKRHGTRISTFHATAKDDEDAMCWNPKLRKVIGSIAGAGVLETAYLTYTEVAGKTTDLLCSAEAASCNSVLTGPYAHLPGTDIPLASLGLLAYSSVLILAVGPLFFSKGNNEDDSTNRVALTAATTTMGTFSVLLMTILFGVLHQSCPYCLASAVFSIALATLSWLGGALPNRRAKDGVGFSVGGALLALAAAVFLVVGNSDSAETVAGRQRFNQQVVTTTLIAESRNKKQDMVSQSPPPITTDSSASALALATDLQSLDAAFYGAFWCSHCYDQKQALGRQAMNKIPYVECSKEGVDAQVILCKDKKVPGYPTWEIDGKLYPGEQSLGELRDIVVAAKARK